MFRSITLLVAAAFIINGVSSDKEKLLNFFRSIEGKKIVSGTFGGFTNVPGLMGFSSMEAEGIFNLTMKYPGLYILDCGRGWDKTEPGKETDLIDCFHEDLLQYAKEGGIISINHVLPNPLFPGNDPKDSKPAYGAVLSNEEYGRLLEDGTEERERLLRSYDKVAEGLAAYAAENVTVLYRPHEEMNGPWFWWGDISFNSNDKVRQELFKDLWRDLYHYMSDKKGLKDLIWIYSPVVFTEHKTSFYPGDEYVDMVGLDVYLNDFNMLTGYEELVNLGKPFAFAEVGPQHDASFNLAHGPIDYTKMIETINSHFPKAVYVASWNEKWSPIRNKNPWGLYNNDRVLNRGDFVI